MTKQVFIPKDRDELVKLAQAVLRNNKKASATVGIKPPASELAKIRRPLPGAARALGKIRKFKQSIKTLSEEARPGIEAIDGGLRDFAAILKRMAPTPDAIEEWGYRLTEGGKPPKDAPPAGG